MRKLLDRFLKLDVKWLCIFTVITLFVKIVFLNQIDVNLEIVYSVGLFVEEILKGLMGGFLFYFLFEYFHIRPKRILFLSSQQIRIKRLCAKMNVIAIYFYYLCQDENADIPKDFGRFKVDSERIDYTRSLKYMKPETNILDSIRANASSLITITHQIHLMDGLEEFQNQILRLQDLRFFDELKMVNGSIVFFKSIGKDYALEGQEALNLKMAFSEFLKLRLEMLNVLEGICEDDLKTVGIDSFIVYHLNKA